MAKSALGEFEQQLLNEVSESALMEYTANVAREVRLSGSEEEFRAFQYVKETLDGFGLKTTLLECDAYISLPGPATLRINGQDFKCITHSMARPTGPSGLTGELVYVGRGLPQDFSGRDARGKIALMDGLAVPAVVKTAQEHGVLGAVFINAAYTHEMIVSSVWGSPTPETVGMLPRIPVVSVNYYDGETIKAALAGGTAAAFMQTEVDSGWRKIPTLIAEIEGTVEPEKFVMFSGHIDSWHYGAMDNGTANATMIETGRLLARYRGRLHRTLRLAFWSGHSHGRYAGSAWYCDTHWEDLHENCVLHVNVDSLGGKGNNILTEANCMSETKGLAADAIAAIVNQEFEGARFGRAGDQSFLGTGTPSLFMGLSEAPKTDDPVTQAFSLLFGAGKAGGFGWWWHTTEDTIDKIDPANLVRDCQVYVAIVYRACASAILPLNQSAAVEELIAHMQGYRKLAGDRLDLGVPLSRLETLGATVRQIEARIRDGAAADLSKAPEINEGLMELSRALVPLNYVRGSIFEHDPGMKFPPIPSLMEVAQLAEAEEGSDDYYMYRTLLARRVNEINHTLRQANRAAETLLAKL